MIRNIVMGAILGLGLTVTSSAAVVWVQVAPPTAVVETVPAPPSSGYVWVGGYHRWDGNAYVWTPGRWDRPPHEHARWVAHRWVHRNGGYVLVEGHWR